MNSNPTLLRCLGMAVAVLALGFFLLPSPASNQPVDLAVRSGQVASEANPNIFPPGSHPYGRSYAEWVALCGQALLATPYDPTASILGKAGHVAFLSANLGGSAVFWGTVPAGTAFLFVVVTDIELAPFWCGEGTGAPNCTVEELRAVAAELIEPVTLLEAEIDGAPLENLWDYRVASTVWDGTADENNIFAPLGVVGPYGPAVADGYWVMTTPLPPGDHTIRFHAVSSDGFETESIHHLTVLPRGGRGQPPAILGTESRTWSMLKLFYK